MLIPKWKGLLHVNLLNILFVGSIWVSVPIVSMYGIFSYIYHKNQPNVGIYTIHGSYGVWYQFQKSP